MGSRGICEAFEKQFGAPLAKSSLGRWREAAGQDLVEQYRLARFQATQLLESLQQTGESKFDLVMATVEDHLLTAMRQIGSQDPLKLIALRQKDCDQRMKQRSLELKEKQVTLQEEHVRRQEELRRDRLQIGLETWGFIVSWLKRREPGAVELLLRHRKELADGLAKFLEKAAPA